jgi:hypothetical protein
MNRPIVFGIVLFLIAFAGVAFLIHRRPVPAPAAPQRSAASVPQEKLPEAPRRRINVRLFFEGQGTTLLEGEDRAVPYQEDLRAQLEEVFHELLAGPQSGLVRVIPEGSTLLDLFISKDGIVYADFSSDLADKNPGGIDEEIHAVYSIVNTVTYNFPQLKQVQILINDHEVDSLNGHLDLGHPLEEDLSIVVHPSAATQTAQTQDSPS